MLKRHGPKGELINTALTMYQPGFQRLANCTKT